MDSWGERFNCRDFERRFWIFFKENIEEKIYEQIYEKIQKKIQKKILSLDAKLNR